MPKSKQSSWGGTRKGAGPKIQSLKLSHAESMLITAALNGIILDHANAEAQIPIEVAEALRLNQLDAKWDVDGDALIEKLSKLSHAVAIEIADNVSKFWSNSQ